MKFILAVFMSIIFSSCTPSYDRYLDLSLRPNYTQYSPDELSTIIRETFPFISVHNIHGQKGWIYLGGHKGDFFVKLRVGDNIVIVADWYFNEEGKYQSEKGEEFSQFVLKLTEILQDKEARVDVSKFYHKWGVFID